MGRVGAAAAADQVHAVLGDETFQPARQLRGAERIMRVAIDQFRQPGIRQHRDQARPVGRQPAHVLGHFLRAGGAVQPHQRHVQRVHHRGGGGDVGADQQRAGGLHRDLHEDRHVAAGRRARDLGAVHRGLDLQRVLAGLHQDRVHAAGDQAAALFGQRRLQRVVGDVAEARQLGAGADAAQHPAMRARRQNSSAASRASSPAMRLISKARSASWNSPSVTGEPPKLLVSTMSAPAAKKPRWMSRTMSGRDRFSTSVQFSLPQ